MISDLMLVVGAAVLAAALRSFRHPVLFRLGTLAVAGTSFLAGWLLGGSLVLGVLCAASWLFLPWVEILTRIRRLRLPIERTLTPRTPPSRSTFPAFEDLTSEIEGRGFEFVDDTGWEDDDGSQFYRVFRHAERRSHAAICLVEQHGLAFYYLSLTSRAMDGRVFVSWNYPFSYGLKMFPRLHMNRVTGTSAFDALVASHDQFLDHHAVGISSLLDEDEAEIIASMQSDMRAQISHNLAVGVLKHEDARTIRYTVRGMFFLWFQFLRDLVRLS